MRRGLALVIAALILAGCSGSETGPLPPPFREPTGAPAAVYTMSDAAGGNRVLAWRLATNGTLDFWTSVATGGAGSGGALDAQASLAEHPTASLLFAVNAGSGTVTSLALAAGGPTVLDEEPTGGLGPASAAAHGSLLYVLNATAPASLSGFTINPEGTLEPLPGSARALSVPDPSPAQVAFSPDGGFLLVTERATHQVDVFPVGEDGLLGPLQATAAPAATPSGFVFDESLLILAMAAGGMATQGAAASLLLEDDGTLPLVSGPVACQQTGTALAGLSRKGKFAYLSNPGSDTVTGFAVGDDGVITLLDADGVTAQTGAGSAPRDLAELAAGSLLVVLEPGTGSLGSFDLEEDGSLTQRPDVGGVPTTASGLVAR